MYLTKAMPILGDDYQCHQEIRKHVPSPGRVLFQRTDCCLLVVSESKPVDGEFGLTKELKVGEDTEYLFSIRLNPSFRNKKTGKREVVTDLRRWIEKKLTENGMEANFQYRTEGMRKSGRGDKVVTLASVFVMGMLIVKDRNLFRGAVERGIGHAKGFGFGLLNVF